MDKTQTAEQQFTDWFVRNYPQDTHIYDPAWHAERIFRIARIALAAAPADAQQSIATFAQAERFLKASLKPEEISGAERENRLRELMGWFDRFLDGNANGKWFRSHAYELCYALATMPLYAAAPEAPQQEAPHAALADEADCHDSCGYIGAECEFPYCKNPAQTVPEGWRLVPDRLVKLFCNAIDNLSDMPISDAWAEKWSKEADELLEAGNYFRRPAAAPAAPQQEDAILMCCSERDMVCGRRPEYWCAECPNHKR